MEKKWWHKKCAYQIYPKSFLDTNGDGIGDLKGIINKLDYLKGLGVDFIWLSPVYPSPMKDNGYDISDYYGIDPAFGTMEEMDRLIAEAKKRDMGIIMDLVVNHSSDQHKWFREAVKNPEGKYGKYYYIMDGKDQNPPNNWRSYFGGSVWEKLPGYENKFYLHLFAKEQPDLNWENEELREEIYKMVNWWLEKGLAGFRIDAIINIKKDLTWQSFEADGPDGLCGIQNMLKNAKGVGVFLRELRDRCFRPHDAFTVGEVFDITEDQLEEFAGDNGYFSSMFAFGHCMTGHEGSYWHEYRPVDFKEWRARIFQDQVRTAGLVYESNIIENHDEPRGASNFIPEEDYGFPSVSALAAISILQHGLPFLYQGQEIGMTNCRFESIEEYDDISTKDCYQAAILAGLTKEEALESCYRYSRDNARTPMQWNSSKNAGFTAGTPWLKVNPNYRSINVAAQEKEYGSILNYYKRLLAFRKSEEYGDLFAYGSFQSAYEDTENILAFFREDDTKKILVLCNYSSKESSVVLKEEYNNIIFVNYPKVTQIGNTQKLLPYQLIVAEYEK